MRFGRIILALLAPLVSTPAVAGHVQDSLQPQAPAVDSLLQFLRSVVPVVAATAELETQAAPQADRMEWPRYRPETPAPIAAVQDAALRLLLRQQHRSLLRC